MPVTILLSHVIIPALAESAGRHDWARASGVNPSAPNTDIRLKKSGLIVILFLSYWHAGRSKASESFRCSAREFGFMRYEF